MEENEKEPSRRPGSFISLLGRDGESGSPPPSHEERSTHNRHHTLEPPGESFDVTRAEAVCAQICRDALRDFAPGLVFLDASERRRLQALVAYTRTLFDFTNDRSLEGERLAQINRWQFALDQSLDVEPIGQPIFIQMAAIEKSRPWKREELDRLAVLARRRITTPEAAVSDAPDIAACVAHIALEKAPGPPLVDLLVDLVEARLLFEGEARSSPPPRPLARLRAELRDTRSATRGQPPGPTRALRYCREAANELLCRAQRRGDEDLSGRPLGLFARVRLLARARFGR